MARLLILLVCLTPSLALADVVPMAPTSCPPGAVGGRGHMGRYCKPTTCTSVAECERYRGSAHGTPDDASFECAPAGLCVSTMSVHGGRGHRTQIEVVHASCETDADCPEGIACEITDRCWHFDRGEPETTPPIPREYAPRQADCEVGATSTAALLVVLLVAGGWVARRATSEDRAGIAHALGPLAARLRVEADDEGELRYELDEADDEIGAARPSGQVDPRG